MEYITYNLLTNHPVRLSYAGSTHWEGIQESWEDLK